MRKHLRKIKYVVSNSEFLYPFKKIGLYRTKNKLPKRYLIETTNLCNLKCRLCSNPCLRRKKENMNFEQFLKIFNEIKKHAKHIDFDFGGEPLINPETLKMVAYSDKYGINTSFATNAHFLNKENIDKIFSSGLKKIILSFGGMTKKSYIFYHEGGNFELAKKNIELLCGEKAKKKAKYPFIELSFLVTKKNEKEIPDVMKFSKKIGVDQLLLKSLHTSWAKEANLEEFLPRNKKYHRQSKMTIPCSWIHTLSLYVNGDATTCCYDMQGDNVYGNVLKEGVLDLWKKSYPIRVRQFKRGFGSCKGCPQLMPMGKKYTKKQLQNIKI